MLHVTIFLLFLPVEWVHLKIPNLSLDQTSNSDGKIKKKKKKLQHDITVSKLLADTVRARYASNLSKI